MSPGATVLITSGSFSLISSVWTWIQGIFLAMSRSDVLISARPMINSSFTFLSKWTFWTCRWKTPVNPQTPGWAASARPTRCGWSLNPQAALKDKPPTWMWLCGSACEAKPLVLLPKYCTLLPLCYVIYQVQAQCEELLSAWYPLRMLPGKLQQVLFSRGCCACAQSWLLKCWKKIFKVFSPAAIVLSFTETMKSVTFLDHSKGTPDLCMQT